VSFFNKIYIEGPRNSWYNEKRLLPHYKGHVPLWATSLLAPRLLILPPLLHTISRSYGSKISTRKAQRGWLWNKQVVPPVLGPAQQAESKAAIQAVPEAAGIDMANWNWQGVRSKKRLVKANAEKRDAFVADYSVLRTEAEAN
jgi:hypothetical protein